MCPLLVDVILVRNIWIRLSVRLCQVENPESMDLMNVDMEGLNADL